MGFLLSDSTYRRILKAVERIERLRFTGDVEVKGESVYVRPSSPSAPPPPRTNRIIVRVTGNTRDGSNWRWTYNFTEVVKTAAGFGGWTDKSGGLTGTGTLRNLIEDQNGSTGTLGNGVAVANLGTLTPQPIPTGTRIEIWPVTVGTTVEWWCQYENGVDGTC